MTSVDALSSRQRIGKSAKPAIFGWKRPGITTTDPADTTDPAA
jgi:hypothetical protein